jgi:probable rRNA maturation factor
MILFHKETNFELKQKTEYKNWIKSLIKENEKRVGDINYIFCDDEYLLEINQKYLQHDTYTDIITFDYSENGVISGDIFISIERVKENATLFTKGFEEELHRVLAHGILHLCGYKDKTQKESKEMREREECAIQKLKKN